MYSVCTSFFFFFFLKMESNYFPTFSLIFPPPEDYKALLKEPGGIKFSFSTVPPSSGVLPSAAHQTVYIP